MHALDVQKMNRYCVVCEKEFGPYLEAHCTDKSLVAVARIGFQQKASYYSLDGKELADSDLIALKNTETERKEIWKQSNLDSKKRDQRKIQRNPYVSVKPLVSEHKRFYPEYPDDIQVIIHDGGPRITHNRPEVIWVRVIGHKNDVFIGKVLNQPLNLTGTHQGDTISFIKPETSEFPIFTTAKYLHERSKWIIHPCDKCGFDELFDAPSDLIRVIFPNIRLGFFRRMSWFGTFCPLCGGAQIVEGRNKDVKGWQFWK
jgi:hypothetical protein